MPFLCASIEFAYIPGAAVKNILVIEDNDAHARLADIVLSHAGYDCTRASDAIKGLEMIAQTRPDLVIMDLSLPGLSGIDAIKKLRANETPPALPIIAVTSYRDLFPAVEAMRAGANAYVEKTGEFSELVAVVRSLLVPEL